MSDRRYQGKLSMNVLGQRYAVAAGGIPLYAAPAKNARTVLNSGAMWLERLTILAAGNASCACTIWDSASGTTSAGTLVGTIANGNSRYDLSLQVGLDSGLAIECSNHGNSTWPLMVKGRFTDVDEDFEEAHRPGIAAFEGGQADPIYGWQYKYCDGGNGENVLVSAVPAYLSHIVAIGSPAAKIQKVYNCAATADIAAALQVADLSTGAAAGITRVDAVCSTGICVTTDAANSNPEMLFVYHALDLAEIEN